MYYEIDYDELKKIYPLDSDATLREQLELIGATIYKKIDESSKVILSLCLAEFFEVGDYGGLTWRDCGFQSPPRCGRGYYEKFYVSTTLQDFSIMVITENRVDAYLFVNLPECIIDASNIKKVNKDIQT